MNKLMLMTASAITALSVTVIYSVFGGGENPKPENVSKAEHPTAPISMLPPKDLKKPIQSQQAAVKPSVNKPLKQARLSSQQDILRAPPPPPQSATIARDDRYHSHHGHGHSHGHETSHQHNHQNSPPPVGAN